MWAIWQMRQAASSCPSAWECGATCSRKKNESSASETMTEVASRRLGRRSPGCILFPGNKHYPPLLGRNHWKRVPPHCCLEVAAVQERSYTDVPGDIDASGAKKDGILRSDYWIKASGLVARSAVKLATISAQILRTSSSLGFLSSSYFARGI
jgi:hypothetical protein